MDYHNSSYKWNYQDSTQNQNGKTYYLESNVIYRKCSTNLMHICQEVKFYSYFSYSHKILRAFDSNTILASCTTTQIIAVIVFPH
jgi:hypothetical protein